MDSGSFSGVEGCVELYSPQDPSQSTQGLLQGTPRDTYIAMNLNLGVGRGLVWSDQYTFWYTTQNVEGYHNVMAFVYVLWTLDSTPINCYWKHQETRQASKQTVL